MKITKAQLKEIIKEELEEGFLDRMGSKVRSNIQTLSGGHGLDPTRPGEKSGGLAQIDFQVKMGKKYQKALMKMSQSLANDAKKMAGDDGFQRRMQSIIQILDKAAAELEATALRAAERAAKEQ
jgi:soluble cytochrome b562